MWTMNFQMFEQVSEKVRNQRSNCQHLLDHRKSKRIPEIFCFTDYAKVFGCVDHNKLWEILQEIGIPDHLICLLRNLCMGQEATVRTGYGTTVWFKLGKEHIKTILSPCLFNIYAEFIIWNTRLDESQAGIKVAKRNINHLRYADNITLVEKVKRN